VQEILADSTTQSGLVEDERLRSQIMDRVARVKGGDCAYQIGDGEHTDRIDPRAGHPPLWGGDWRDRDWRLEISSWRRRQGSNGRLEIGDRRCAV